MTVPEPFVHPALLYSGAEEYLAGTLSFLRAGLAAGEPVAAAVPAPNLALIKEALGSAAASVHLLDMFVAGRNPGRIIPGVLRAFADRHPSAGRVWIIGEPIWAGRSRTEYPACVQHEALINAAFTGRPVSILCPYDVTALDPAVIADAHATHPVIWRGDLVEASPRYAPERIVADHNRALPAAPADAAVLHFAADNLPEARKSAAENAARLGLAADRIGDVELAVTELTANSLAHGGGSGTLRIWAEDAHLVCEVTDSGHLTDPLAGRRPVGLSTTGGRGLLLVNQVSDLLRVHTLPGRTVFRVYFALPTAR